MWADILDVIGSKWSYQYWLPGFVTWLRSIRLHTPNGKIRDIFLSPASGQPEDLGFGPWAESASFHFFSVFWNHHWPRFTDTHFRALYFSLNPTIALGDVRECITYAMVRSTLRSRAKTQIFGLAGRDWKKLSKSLRFDIDALIDFQDITNPGSQYWWLNSELMTSRIFAHMKKLL